ncbi:Bacteriophytochrome (light-regulated signal transduction histidine kinase) [Marinobacter daqiaonensis]|uniref:histidine kinase n=1 Tax=Marinobacter daqiaonensis TaxID=650891 RepID=A0A1I6ILG7_9GAMM|nr:ATP-binding protein [Marinobacter daqiaonensis]SFR67120.1 Bacteriophytochrome (light-regulated signal transduction histidine kinase) [Marinobacter daqiaonensis]
MSERFSDQFDFTRCEEEPIRTPGSIQAFGAVRVLAVGLDRVLAESADASQWFSRLPEAGEMGLPASFAGALEKAIARDSDWPVRETLRVGAQRWHLTGHYLPEAAILVEVEPGNTGPDTVGTAVSDLEALIGRVKAARSVDELMTTAAEAIRGITGFDRVMVYRFAEDWHGEVVAESRADHMASYLGLHFPASDIPPQARALYVENQIRLIASVDAPVIPVYWTVSNRAPAELDLSQCSLRAVSPIHLQYLRNMGVQASMSISLMRDGQLWGMVACHHATPRHVTLDARMGAKLVGDVLSMCLRLVEDADTMRARLQHSFHQREVTDRFVHSDELVPALRDSGEDLRRLFRASGLLIAEGERTWLYGTCPNERCARLLANHVGERMKANGLGLYQRNGWSTPLFDHQELTAAGVLALAPTADYRVLVLWLRAHEPEEVAWAGAPEKAPEDPLNPRHSFSQWREQRRGLARPWQPWEMEAADELLSDLRQLSLRQMERLQRLSENLERSNRDLEDFAFIASHDLQEPLRKIEAFSTMIQEEAREGQLEGLDDYLDRISSSSRRLRALVGDLLTYSRVGRLDYSYSRCDWRKVIDRVLELLDGEIAQAGAEISLEGDFPVTYSAPVLVRMIFQNLISNAIKYRASGRPPRIEIRSRRVADGWQVTVNDNGIGFSQDKADAIFRPFLRLHSKSRYPGSGIGLAIVRKAASRIDTQVDATSEPGKGSCFRLQVRAPGDSEE